MSDNIIKSLRSSRQRWCDDYWKASAEMARLEHELSVRAERLDALVESVHVELDEAEELGYSHQSNESIRILLDRVVDAFNGPDVEEKHD